jgi:hypothetical protein
VRLEEAVEARLREAAERHRVGQVSAVVGNQVTVSLSGSNRTIPRLATWTPVIGDIVLVALTPAGWIALGKIA